MTHKIPRKVRLVVLVDVKEDIQSRTARKKSNKARRRIKALMKRFGNAKAKDRSGIDYDSDATFDDEMYENLESAIEVEDWVGPIQANWNYGTWSTVIHDQGSQFNSI